MTDEIEHFLQNYGVGSEESMQSGNSDMVRIHTVLSLDDFPIYVETAEKLTAEGLGRFKISEAVSQIGERGQPLLSSQIAVTRVGQRDWSMFYAIIHRMIENIEYARSDGKSKKAAMQVAQRVLLSNIETQKKLREIFPNNY